jgi:hypothetical protein
MTFPADFFAAKKELARFCAAQSSRALLLIADDDVTSAKKNLPEDLVPFMIVEGRSWPDIYAFDRLSAPLAVVVWSGHAIVERWDNFEDFLRWIRDPSVEKSQ